MIKLSKDKIHTVYKNDEGMRLPGVTTILNMLSKPALIPWAWKLGTQGIDYRKYRDDKADIGTLAHAYIMAHHKGEKVDDSCYSKDQIDQAANSLLSYYEWEKGHTIKPLLIEEILISKEYGYGGTPDLVCILDGKLTLLDFKTGKGIYEEMHYQVGGAYRKLVEEAGHKVEQVIILNIPRSEDESFKVQYVNNFENNWQIFFCCLQIYKLKKANKKKEK